MKQQFEDKIEDKISPDSNKAIYQLLGKLELAIFPGVFNTTISRVKISKPYL